MNDELEARLDVFLKKHSVKTKGPLCVVLHVTRFAIEQGTSLKKSDLLTENKGQVSGLGQARVQGILEDYGIKRTLAREAGRTSRGSIGLMENYVKFLNRELKTSKGKSKLLKSIEKWWIGKVNDHFASQPFRLRYDPAKSIQEIIRDMLQQAKQRQSKNPGTTYEGTMLQHLVGAKLDLFYEGQDEITIEHHGASVADAPTARSGDFVIKGSALHVTVTPSEALMDKCHANLGGGVRPIEKLIKKYNDIVAAHETDPSMRFELK